jgi:hypothetical protein
MASAIAARGVYTAALIMSLSDERGSVAKNPDELG